jgi:pyruvate kinase
LRFYRYVLIIYISKRLSRKLEIKSVGGTEDMDSQTSDFEQETSSHFDDGNISSDSINLDIEQETEILFDDGNISSDVEEEDEDSLARSDDEIENDEELYHDTQWTKDAFDVKVSFEDVGEDMKQK